MAHEKYMNHALNLARQGLGRTGNNPSVGCVIIRDGKIIAAARTADSGRPHAEAAALAGIDANGATAYVTLEPCAHEGSTPSCAQTLAKAGIKTAIIATRDPDIRTAGKGIQILKDAGIEVIEGVCEAEARLANIGFFKRLESRKPFIALKVATDAENNYLPAKDGKPSWITGELSRQYVHMLRSKFDVIVTGTGTVLADNPSLNVRLAGMENLSPVKIIIGNSEIPQDFDIFKGKEALQLNGDLSKIITNLTAAGTSRVIIEAGPKLSNAFLHEGLVDEIYWFKSEARNLKSGVEFLNEDLIKKFKKTSERKFGSDLLVKLSN